MKVRTKAQARWSWGAIGLSALLCASLGCGKKGDLPPAENPSTSATTEEGPQPKADMSCGMKVFSSPPTQILVDGKAVGTSPVTVDHLKPGVHDVTFVDEDNGNVTLQVTRAEGQFQEVVHNLPPKATDIKGGGK